MLVAQLLMWCANVQSMLSTFNPACSISDFRCPWSPRPVWLPQKLPKQCTLLPSPTRSFRLLHTVTRLLQQTEEYPSHGSTFHVPKARLQGSYTCFKSRIINPSWSIVYNRNPIWKIVYQGESVGLSIEGDLYTLACARSRRKLCGILCGLQPCRNDPG